MAETKREDDAFKGEAAKHRITERIEDLMRAKGITKADLARLLGKSRAYVSKLLRGGENLTVESLVKIGQVLGCELRLGYVDQDVRCVVCGNPITETGSAIEGNPCHISCYHLATCCQTLRGKPLINDIIAQFSDPSLFKKLGDHHTERFGPSPLKQEYADWLMDNPLQPDVERTLHRLSLFAIRPRVRFFLTQLEFDVFVQKYAALPLAENGHVDPEKFKAMMVSLFGDETAEQVIKQMDNNMLLDFQITTNVVQRFDVVSAQRQ